MARTNLKVVDLLSYKATQEALQRGEIEAVLSERTSAIKALDLEVLDLLSGKHRLKAIRRVQRTLAVNEKVLVTISDWLREQVSTETIRAYQDECKELFLRRNRIKENLRDAAEDDRHIEIQEETNLVEAGGFLAGIPTAAMTLTSAYLSKKQDDILHAGEAGLAFGTLLAFHKQIGKILTATKETLVNLPNHSQAVKSSIRSSMISAACVISVSAKQQNSIQPSLPIAGVNRPRVVVESRL